MVTLTPDSETLVVDDEAVRVLERVFLALQETGYVDVLSLVEGVRDHGEYP